MYDVSYMKTKPIDAWKQNYNKTLKHELLWKSTLYDKRYLPLWQRDSDCSSLFLPEPSSQKNYHW